MFGNLKNKVAGMLGLGAGRYMHQKQHFGNGKLLPQGDGAAARRDHHALARRQAEKNKKLRPTWSSKHLAGKAI